ncbi:MAG TPA: hypothetical protein PLN86_16860 [Candidatus Hydrogenedentes bacterium]|nr:hypothetical protein [Candidatus Hydrogenedentota bacterium]
MSSNLIAVLIVLVLTLVSGYFDSRGFLFASEMWVGGKLVIDKLVKSGLGFGLGIISYWVVLRFLKDLHIALSTEVQTLGWFGVTLILVAFSSGEFLKWALTDRIIALIVLLGIGFLLFRGH